MDYDLRDTIKSEKVGSFIVNYAYVGSSLDNQQAAFDLSNLSLVSPAQLSFMRKGQSKGHSFLNYSRTNMDVFYDPNTSKIVLIKNGPLGNRFIKELVSAHSNGNEAVISKGKERDFAYAVIESAKNNNAALVVEPGNKSIDTKDFGINDLTDFLFTDVSIGAKAQDYGDYINDVFDRKAVTAYFDDSSYMKSQKGPYLNKIRARGPDYDFNFNGYFRNLNYNNGAFGVRFESAEGSAQNSAYTPTEKSLAEKSLDGVMDGTKGMNELKPVKELFKKL